MIKKGILLLLVFSFFLFVSDKANAASLINLSDTISTSRPSAASPLDTNQTANAGQVQIIDNGSFFLASDSARLMPDTGETLNTVTVASMSAADTPSSGKRIVYFGNTAANTHHAGDALVSAVTAMHKISFTTVTNIPAGGKIVLTFPGTANTTASPSATTFAFNGLATANAAANISYRLDGTRTCTFAVATSGQTPTITCTVDAGGAVAPGTTITFLIGCADNSSNATTCTTQSPRLMNPTKSSTAGTADKWKVNVKTQDASSVDIDESTTSIGVIESVLVTATVDPSLTFSISGITDGQAVNTGNTTGCLNTETANTGLTPSATAVNMGVLSNTPTNTNTKIGNIAAQLLTITTNAQSGYSLTATSSSKLMNPATGFSINSDTTPVAFPNGTDWFGIHACGLDVTAATWSTGSDQSCNTYITGSAGDLCKYGWPSNTAAVSLASDSNGPVGNSIVAGNGLTTVEYAAGVDASVPAGIYRTAVTYVATPVF